MILELKSDGELLLNTFPLYSFLPQKPSLLAVNKSVLLLFGTADVRLSLLSSQWRQQQCWDGGGEMVTVLSPVQMFWWLLAS